METESKLTQKRAKPLVSNSAAFYLYGTVHFPKLFLFAFMSLVGMLDKGKFFKKENKMETTSHPVIIHDSDQTQSFQIVRVVPLP